jgi:hypothetical protein
LKTLEEEVAEAVKVFEKVVMRFGYLVVGEAITQWTAKINEQKAAPVKEEPTPPKSKDEEKWNW